MELEKYKWKYSSKSNRVQWFDYSSNWAYFVTICTKNRENSFWEIIDWEMVLNEFGDIVKWFWLEIVNHFSFVVLDEFVIMPNHIHGILLIQNNVETRQYSQTNIIKENNNVETRHCLVSDDNIIKIDNYILSENNNEILIDSKTRQCLVSTDNHIPTNNQAIKLNRFQNQWKWTISSIIGSFKSICTKTINKSQNHTHFAWQSNYYDRIIRNEDELSRIRKYIQENPQKRHLDKNNSENIFM